ncbi:MAG TPA: FecR domain-containing protein [Polyangiaceae bacterium]|nr:FecR domain-containing protein [Polyangiaceae bacterium]
MATTVAEDRHAPDSSSSTSSSRSDVTFVVKAPTQGDGERIASEAATLASPFPSVSGPKRRRAFAVAALATGLCGAALWLVFAQPRSSSSALPSTPPAPTARGLALHSPGSTSSDRALTRAGEDSCGELTPGITLCTTKGTEVDRVELGDSERVLYLNEGRAIASVAQQPSGASFRVVTAAGSITATSAVFSVQVDESGTTARVSRGAVALRTSQNDGGRPLLAGQMLRLGTLESSRLPPEEASKDRTILERLGRLSFHPDERE